MNTYMDELQQSRVRSIFDNASFVTTWECG